MLATGYPALEELRTEGIVGAIGAGMNQSKMLADLVRETDIDVVMLAGRPRRLLATARETKLAASARTTPTREARRITEFLLDPHELVVLRDPLTAHQLELAFGMRAGDLHNL